ncbi:MAG TPA: UDP-N-acetylenolpyruvoylglucosamine reductase [Lachnospiraceae bacterium]|nr:UDP-N-acetylenolpyruvoylglucosamine reductase [Lachnospiraceae bacterium]
MKQEFIDRLLTIVDKDNVLLDEPMSRHTTFRIGGNADVLVEISRDEIVDVIKLCCSENVPYTVLGNGSNVLVGDKGIRGVTISIGKRMSNITVVSDVIKAEAGALLSRAANFALNEKLSGMEFAAGIPGSVGGAVLMNAGAYGGEIKDILVSADVLTPEGVVKCYSCQDLDLSYRHSRIMDEGGIVLSAEFRLTVGDYDNIKSLMQDFNSRRIEKQPLNYPSAGSTFKRPKGYFAGKLIEDSNLRGYKVGGAMVSEKHCGFVINYENASANDVRVLMEDVSKKVYEDSNVRLEPEVRFIGEFE